MSKSSGGGSSKGGGKSRGAGAVKGEAIVTQKKIKTKEDHIFTLRKALFTDQGQDKDVAASFAPFLSFKRNGLDVGVEFQARLSAKERKWAYALSTKNMAGVELSMTESEKIDELKYKANRFLVIREKPAGASDYDEGKMIGYLMFRFTMQGELLDEMAGQPAIFVYDLQILPGYQRKGLGHHLMNLIQLIGRKEGMGFASIIVPDGCEPMESFIENKLKTFEEDCFDYADVEEIEMDAITVFHRCIDPSLVVKPAAAVKPTAAVKPAAAVKAATGSVAGITGITGITGPVVTEANKENAQNAAATPQPAR